MAAVTLNTISGNDEPAYIAPNQGAFLEYSHLSIHNNVYQKIEQRAVIMSFSKYCFAHDPASSDGIKLLHTSRSNILMDSKILSK